MKLKRIIGFVLGVLAFSALAYWLPGVTTGIAVTTVVLLLIGAFRVAMKTRGRLDKGPSANSVVDNGENVVFVKNSGGTPT